MPIHSTRLRTLVPEAYTKVMLTVIAVFLGIIALRPAVKPAPVQAQSDYSYLYVEPGTTSLRKPDGTRQVEGKIVVDMRNGDVWGFPTLSGMGLPYPVDPAHRLPPVSEPMYLGQFDFSNLTPAERQKAFPN